MARKIDPPAPETGADDLEILHPEQRVTVGGRELVVREFGFVEGLQIHRSAQPFVRAIADAQEVGPVSGDDVVAILADHADAVIAMIAVAADIDETFVRGLSDADGQLLMMVWWRVNQAFFIHRVGVEREVRNRSAGPTSTPPSSSTDTGATTSADIPAGS